MALSNDIISKFVKMSTENNKAEKKETTVYGTVSRIENEQVYVKLDGATDTFDLKEITDIGTKEIKTISTSSELNNILATTTSINEGIAYQYVGPTTKKYAQNSYYIIEANSDCIELPVANAVEVFYDEDREVNKGDRVIVMIKNHSAIVTNNLTTPSANKNTTNTLNQNVNNALNAADTANKNAKDAIDAVVEFQTTIVKKLDTDELVAKVGSIDNLTAEEILVEVINVNTGNIDTLDVNTANIEKALVKEIDAETGDIKYAKISELDAATADVKDLKAGVADINSLIFDGATGDTIHTNFSNSVIAQVGDAQIKSAMIQDIDAGKIQSGSIDTNKVNIQSEDGSFVIANNRLQIKEGETVRVQIGKDGNGNYSVSICDTDGNVIFCEDGITEDGIPDNIIVNDMVANDANIHASKLDIDSLFEEINSDGTNVIKSTKITVDEQGQTLDAAFKKMATTESVDNLSKTVSSQGAQISANTEAISTKVWQQDINTAVDAIDVGGRNLYIVKNSEEGFLTVGGTTWGAMDQVHQEHTSEYILVREGEQYVFQVWVTVNESYGNDPNLWMGYDFFDADKNTISNRPAKRSLNKLPNGQCYDVYHITIPAGATYLRVSARFYADGLVKLEKGNVATEWTPAPEDVSDSITNLSTKYTSIEQTVDGISTTVSEHSSKIEDKADRSTVTEVTNKVSTLEQNLDGFRTTVSSTYATKTELNTTTNNGISGIKIGGRNLYIEKDAVDGYLSSNGDGSITVPSSVTKEKTSGLIPVNPGDKVQFQLWVTTPETSYIWYAYQFFKEDGTALDTNRPSQHLYDTTGGYYHVTYPTITVSEGASYIRVSARMFEDGKIKVEIGTKATDWTPAPEDMATDDDLTRAQAATEEVSSRVTTAESLIEQLAHSISILVTDGNGTSLMTQTDTGWMFSTADIQNAVNRISEDLSTLTDDVGNVDNTVSILQQAVDDLGVLGEYIQITTYEDEPCIELGELDSDFKLRITNTRMMFTEGAVVLAYFTNQSFHSKKVVVEEELQQGGFVWKVRANGNLGLVWKGGNS